MNAALRTAAIAEPDAAHETGIRLRRRWSVLALSAGFLCVVLYWLAVAPPDPGWLGYSEDIGNQELARVLMADSLREHGGPAFHTNRLFAPDGGSAAYFSWMMERDWLGAYLWSWAPSFPWLWVYFGLSLAATFVVVAWTLTHMAIRPPTAFLLATLFVLFNLARHYKIYHHYEHIIHHWLYASLFLDALIAHRFWRERRWSLHLELWRGVCLIGMLGNAGYYWGPLVFEWIVVRAVLLGALRQRSSSQRIRIELASTPAWAATTLGGLLLIPTLRWLLPLASEMNRFGEVAQLRGYYASLAMIVRPLWLEPMVSTLRLVSPESAGAVSSMLREWRLSPVDWPETIVTVGWIYLVPCAVGLWLLGRRRDGAGLHPLRAFLITWIFAALYARQGWPSAYHELVAQTVPFMRYFRAASRMGLILVPLMGVIVALCWPDLSRWTKERWSSSRRFRLAAGAFVVLSASELSTMLAPIVTMPPLLPQMTMLLGRIREEPGSLVLDMPFCVAGGNGACTPEFCKRYPSQTMPMYLTAWHGKRVFGGYQGRMNDSQCAKYRAPPYASWIDAWRNDRCLTRAEWDGFCEFLADTGDVSAVLVYPALWTAASGFECAREFRRRLGGPRGAAEIATRHRRARRGAELVYHDLPTPVLWYGGQCILE